MKLEELENILYIILYIIKKIESENIKNRLVRLYGFEERITTPKIFKMKDIMSLINNLLIIEEF